MSLQSNTHLDLYTCPVGRTDRFKNMGQSGATLWLTGLSGAGKSTLAFTLDHLLTRTGKKCYVLDGDDLRKGLCSDLAFSIADRQENIRRVGEVALLAADAGLIVLCCLISPFRDERREAREQHRKMELPFIEIFLDTPLEICEKRDPKRLYARARKGEIADLTGVNSPYEVPENPEIIIRATQTPEQSSEVVVNYLKAKNLIE